MVITFMNMKGGVGKTTTCIHVASAFALLIKKRVLIIDYDPHFNASQYLMSAKEYYSLNEKTQTVLAVLSPRAEAATPFKLLLPLPEDPIPSVSTLARSIVNFKNGGKLHLIPGTLALMYPTLGQPSESLTPMEERFDRFIKNCREQYDHVFIDCHPAGSFLTKTALLASDHVVLPVAPDSFSKRGIILMHEFLAYLSTFGKDPKLWIIFNRVPRYDYEPQISNEI